MPALDFPATPTNGQVYTQDGSSWTYDSTKGTWRSSPYEPGAAITSATAPTTPQNGDIWFNTNDGTLYTYYNDGTSSQWVELRSEIAKSQVGLVPIAPTSVTVGSGTASVAADGRVTFTGCGSFIVNGVFSSAYTNYQVIYRPDGMSAADYIYTRFATSGTANTTSAYYFGGWYTQGGTYGLSANSTSSSTYVNIGYSYGDKSNTTIIELANPFLSTSPTQAFYRSSYSFASHTQQHGSFVFNGNTSFDGIQFGNINTGNQSGTIKIYGYN